MTFMSLYESVFATFANILNCILLYFEVVFLRNPKTDFVVIEKYKNEDKKRRNEGIVMILIQMMSRI